MLNGPAPSRIALSSDIARLSLGLNCPGHDFMERLVSFVAFLEYFVLYDETVIRQHPELGFGPNWPEAKMQWDEAERRFEDGLIDEIEYEELLSSTERLAGDPDEGPSDFDVRVRMENDEVLSGFLSGSAVVWVSSGDWRDWDAEAEFVAELYRSPMLKGPLDLDDQRKLLELRLAFRDGIGFAADYTPRTRSMVRAMAQEDRSRRYQLKAAYDKLAGSLQRDVLELLEQRSSLSVYVPPVPAIVFKRAGKPSRIAAEAWGLREELATVKQAFAEYEHAINDDSLSLKDSLSALRRLKVKTAEICGNEPGSLSIDVSEWRDLADLSVLMDGLTLADAPSLLKVLLGKPAQLTAKKLLTSNVSYFVKMKREFLEIRNFGSLIQDMFHVEITSRDLKTLDGIMS